MTSDICSWPDLAGRFEGRVHRLPIRIYYEDTDFSGVVYHANYLRFAERGRSDFLRLAGIGHRDLFEDEAPLAFAVHRMSIEFLAPARIDDILEVATIYRAARGARIEAEQAIYRLQAEGGDSTPLFRASVRAACIDGAGRPRRLPREILAHLEPFLAPTEAEASLH